MAPGTGRARRSMACAPAALLCLFLLAGGALGCGGEEEVQDDLEPARGDTPAATEPDLELQPPVGEPEESDLPGIIPPAVGEADEPGGVGTGDAASAPDSGAQGTTSAGTDGGADRPGVTAFTGATGRGQYLAEQVAMCVQCHSPKDETGRVIAERKFQGSPIPVASPYRGQDWAVEAPALAGMAFYTREEAVRLLTRGIARDGEPPSPPMPPFRMNEQDAAAVYEYLASLPRAP